jgi:hypothetical protein
MRAQERRRFGTGGGNLTTTQKKAPLNLPGIGPQDVPSCQPEINQNAEENEHGLSGCAVQGLTLRIRVYLTSGFQSRV